MSELNTTFKTNKKEVSLLGLFGKETLENLQKKLAEATDFSFSIIDFKGEEITNSLILNNYCDNKKSTGACQGCRMSCAFAAAKAAFTNNPYVFECEQGLVETAIPIIVNNQYLGAVLCGRVRCSDKENLPDAIMSESPVQPVEEKNASLAEYYQEIPEFSCRKIRAISTLVNDYFKEICTKESYGILLSDYDRKETHLRDLRSRINAAKEEVKKANMRSLRAVLYPQLLSTMLVTISNFAILEGAEQTEEVIEGLASVLRYYSEQDKDRIILSQEIKQIEYYIKILVERYGNRLQSHIQYKKENEKQVIPKLCLIPLVEYVVNFGILSNHSRGTFHLDTTFSVERCVITIQYEQTENDIQTFGYLNQSGNILDEASFKEQIENIKKRLEYEFNGDYSLKLHSDLVVLDIPRTSESKEVIN